QESRLGPDERSEPGENSRLVVHLLDLVVPPDKRRRASHEGWPVVTSWSTWAMSARSRSVTSPAGRPRALLFLLPNPFDPGPRGGMLVVGPEALPARSHPPTGIAHATPTSPDRSDRGLRPHRGV